MGSRNTVSINTEMKPPMMLITTHKPKDSRNSMMRLSNRDGGAAGVPEGGFLERPTILSRLYSPGAALIKNQASRADAILQSPKRA
jgi:hypothetical protein